MKIKNYVLRNRYTLLLTVLAVHMVVIVIEGRLTGREARVIEFDNPFMDLNIENLDQLMQRDD